MMKRLLTLTICLLFLFSIADAWKAGYGYRKKITIQGANLDGNLTHFPVLIYIVDADIDDHCDDDGDRSHDILFTQSDDTTLDVNWEDYSEAGGNATITAWVSDAGWTIQSDGSTEIYLYYGNAAAGDPGTDAGVWDSNFKGVWHLNEIGDGSDDEFVDSSANSNHGTGGGPEGSGDSGKTPTQTTGKVYKGQDFDGTDDHIQVTHHSSLNFGAGDFTAEFWAYSISAASNDVILWKYPSTEGWRFYFAAATDFKFYIKYAGVAAQYRFATTEYADGVWHHVVFVHDADGNDMWYVNGAADGSVGASAQDTDNAGNFTISSDTADFDGDMDEVRLSNSVRSGDWAKFVHANMNEGDNELTWGGEEEAPSGFIPRVIIIR